MKTISTQEMPQEIKVKISKIQQAVLKIKEARRLLVEVDGCDTHLESLSEIVTDLEQESDELYSLESK